MITLLSFVADVGEATLAELEDSHEGDGGLVEHPSTIGQVEDLHHEECLIHKSECDHLLRWFFIIKLTVEVLLPPSLWSRRIELEFGWLTNFWCVRDEVMLVEMLEPDLTIVEDDCEDALLINGSAYQGEPHIKIE